LLPSVRADFLARLGFDEARAELEQAASSRRMRGENLPWSARRALSLDQHPPGLLFTSTTIASNPKITCSGSVREH
jgi:hypothetical protein